MEVFMNIIGIVIIFAVIIFIYLFNSMTMKKNAVDYALAVIDVQLKKRFDLIPNLVAATAKYMEHENETLSKLAEMRSNASSVAEKSALDNKITSSLRNYMLQVEAYPDLKASDSIKNLQNSLNEIEAQLAAARRAYNSAVTDFNNAVQTFPGCLLSGIKRFSTRDLFEIPAEERQNVDVNELFKR